MNRMTFNFIMILMIVLAAGRANAQPMEPSIVLQGILRDQQNNAIGDGVYSLTFSFYTSPSGGSAVWSSQMRQVTVQNGWFSEKLSDFSSSVDFSNQYYVGVLVDGMSAELPNRIELTAAPYAMALVGSENVLAGTGNIGIGTTTPDEKLTVNGNMKISGSIELGTGLMAESLLKFEDIESGLYNDVYRPIILTSQDATLGSRLQFFTGTENTSRYFELNSQRGLELSLNTPLRIKNSSWSRGLRFNSNITEALAADNFYISRGGTTNTRDELVFHIDSSAGSTFAILTPSGDPILNANGNSGGIAIGKMVTTDAKLDVEGPIYIKGKQMFELREYAFNGGRDIETGYESSKWTGVIAGVSVDQLDIYRYDTGFRLDCFERNGQIRVRVNLPADGGAQIIRVFVLFIPKELIANPNTPN